MRGAAARAESHRTRDKSRFRWLVVNSRPNEAFTKLEESTKRNWSPRLDRIDQYFGELRIAQFERPEKIRTVIRQWRQRFADKPRTADYGLQVLSRVLAHAVAIGKLAAKPFTDRPNPRVTWEKSRPHPPCP